MEPHMADRRSPMADRKTRNSGQAVRDPRRIGILACAVALAVVGACESRPGNAAGGGGGDSARGDVVAEARAFMDAYARELIAGDRAAIAARYDRTGAFLLGNGRKQFLTYDSIVATYRAPSWSPPASFEWRDLSFEHAGPDAVVVAGTLVWGRGAGGQPITVSYTSLLRRQDGALRIRVEDESIDPTSIPAAPSPSDSARR